MRHKTNKPIFIVGSPRSGTSILAWCLGQHPNIFPVPESNWMGEFAVNIASGYQIGAARDNRTILSAMDISRDEFFANFGHAINDLILAHRQDLERKRELERTLNRKHSTSEPKTRWVDGTPEYSLHVHGLRKLFPEALFIHIVRDVDSVVRSMLNFHRVAGTQLVTTEGEAYKYWLRMVNACLKAEQAYGPRVIHRLQYAALIDNPEAAIRSLLDFVGEPYSAKCLEPLAQRINSSNVPVDFKSEDPATDPKVVEAARRLYAEIQQTPQPAEGSPAVADQLEAAFQEPYLKATRLQQELSDQIAKVKHYAAEIEQYKLQLARQEQHYTAESKSTKSNLPGRNAIIPPKSNSTSYRLPDSSAITLLKSKSTKSNLLGRNTIIPPKSNSTSYRLPGSSAITLLKSKCISRRLLGRSNIIPPKSKCISRKLSGRSNIIPPKSKCTSRKSPACRDSFGIQESSHVCLTMWKKPRSS